MQNIRLVKKIARFRKSFSPPSLFVHPFEQLLLVPPQPFPPALTSSLTDLHLITE